MTHIVQVGAQRVHVAGDFVPEIGAFAALGRRALTRVRVATPGVHAAVALAVGGVCGFRRATLALAGSTAGALVAATPGWRGLAFAHALHHLGARRLGGGLHHVAAGRLAGTAPDGLAAHGDRLGLFTWLGAEAFDVFDGELLLGEAFDVHHEAFLVQADQADGLAVGAGAPGAADAVHVVFADVGNFVVHHVRQVFDVDAAGRDVGGHQSADVAALEAGQGLGARGLDIDDLPYVINYELPHVPEDYVHRIGRTGRAGKQGNAISLVCAREVGYLVDIEKLIKRPIEQVEVAGFEPEPEYEYPPGNKRRRTSAPPVTAPVAHRPERPERPVQGDRRPPRRNPMVAADGFDFSKPYEDTAPRHSLAETQKAPAKADPHKPKRVVAALLGGLGKR